MLELKLNHVSKRGHRCCPNYSFLVLLENCGATNATTFLFRFTLFYIVLVGSYSICIMWSIFHYVCMYTHINFLIPTYHKILWSAYDIFIYSTYLCVLSVLNVLLTEILNVYSIIRCIVWCWVKWLHKGNQSIKIIWCNPFDFGFDINC